MIDNSSVTLEDNITYDVVDKIKDKDHSYIFLVNPNDDSDICIRKEISGEYDNLLIGLNDEEEFKYALGLFLNKNKEEFK